MAKRETKKLFIRGIARYPKTDKAYKFDQAQRKSVPDEDGKLQIEVVVKPDASDKYKGILSDFVKENGKKLEKLKNHPFKAEVDKETDEETGNVIFSAWQYGKSKDGKIRKMAHFDSKGKPLPSDFRLTSGSEVIIAVRANYYETLGGGVNLYLDGVQVVKYRDRDGNPGFGALDEDDGYVREDDDNASGGFADESEGTEDGEASDNTDF